MSTASTPRSRGSTRGPHRSPSTSSLRDREAERRLLASTRAGALVVNGTVVQAAIEALPFGGVGASGFGRYHGRAGFDTFSNMRAHVRVARFTLARMAEPPYTPAKQRLIEWLMRAARW